MIETLAAVILGYVIGGVPTAELIARGVGIDLRSSGSGNPGANNAWRLGGRRVGATVLGVEVAKGVVAVLVGGAMGSPVAAGLGAVIGNLASPFRRLRGGQGLGITAGVLLAAWPMAFLPALAVIGAVTAVTRSTARGALAAVTGLAIAGLGWRVWALPVGWGVEAAELAVLGPGLALLLAPKQLTRLMRNPVRPADHRPSR